MKILPKGTSIRQETSDLTKIRKLWQNIAARTFARWTVLAISNISKHNRSEQALAAILSDIPNTIKGCTNWSNCKGKSSNNYEKEINTYITTYYVGKNEMHSNTWTILKVSL